MDAIKLHGKSKHYPNTAIVETTEARRGRGPGQMTLQNVEIGLVSEDAALADFYAEVFDLTGSPRSLLRLERSTGCSYQGWSSK